ncbi:polyprenyl synthetase family protein [Agromyces badenianii]|uniref:polyprenyl synthetase family protein n=1 Tax=Agromyces badenianii TaxID=2080742 RepID=UPI000D5935DA|nr:polyprenyl synthetase family protein [Agromyces badenianii]PWC05733.1 geranylgeranyl pyrophosphate synthase [Agromyces badenianii]
MIGATLARPLQAGTAAVGEFIDEFFAERLERAARHGDDYVRLWESARDGAAGGKRIRPELVLAAHAAYAGSSTTEAVRLAAAFELLHTAFLMHDDVIDHDLVRRGAPNVAGRFALESIDRGLPADWAHEYGEASAILAGDLLISGALRVVAELEAPRVVRRAVLEIVDECVFLAAAGEHADVRQAVRHAGDAPGERDILAMIENKTASYSFSAPLQAGAMLGGASAASVARLGEIGRHLGVAFQLRDDVLGVYGSVEVTGKSALSDLREGKETLLIAYAREHPDWAQAAAGFGTPELDDAEAARLRSAIESSGARERVERLIDERCAAAVDAITGSDLPQGLHEALTLTARACVERAR